jgi:HAMP domain-containing protein
MRWPSLADARIRSKLGLILVIPVLAILTLAALRLGDANRQAQDAQLVGGLTELSADASAVAQEIHRERMAAAVLLAVSSTPVDAFNRQIRRSDDAISGYAAQRRRLGTVPTNVRDRLQRIDTQFSTLRAIRNAVVTRQGVSLSETTLRYGLIVTELVSYRESLSQVTSDARLADSLIAAAAFSKAKLLIGAQEAILYAALRAGRLDEQQYSAFLATLTGQQEAFVTFFLSADAGQRARIERTIAGDAVQLADNVTSDLRRVGGAPARISSQDASNALGAVNDLMRAAEQQLDADLVASTQRTSQTVRRQVLVEALVIVVLLIIVIALAFGTARSMARTLSRLREGALSVADRRLAEAVNELRDTQSLGERTPEQIANQVPDAIGINTRDEIGEVAQAFHIVHREAVRIAAEQAVLRASVSAMFLNLARRSQTLVDRMIGQLDRIERGEEDPKRLAQLFQLDHLATRMRRNDENVLVLAGADTTPPRRDDAPLADVLQAAQSEVELYERIEFGTVDDDVSIAAHAVNDVVRLLAELLDNATRFSPPTTSVIVEGRRLGDSGHIRIEDRGLGLTADEMAAYNARLAAPPTVDVSTFRMMGLAVVGRLAYRHGIRVRLQENHGGGTVVELVLPTNVLVLPLTRQFTPAPPPFAVGQRGGVGRPPLALDGRTPNAPNAGPHAGSGPPAGWPVSVVTRPADLASTMAGPPANAHPAPPMNAHPAPPANTHPMNAAPPNSHPVNAQSMGPPAVNPPPESGRWADLVPDRAAEEAVAARARADDDTAELPIFREIEAAWFRTHGHSATGGWPTLDTSTALPQPRRPAAEPAQQYQAQQYQAQPPPAAVHQPVPERQPAPAPQPAPPPAAARPAPPPPPPAPAPDPAEVWRSRADAGWRAAAAATEPPVKDRTRSGLPKRQPRAQLVPGGVGGRPAVRTPRTPEEVRGRLSAYHRGVQRGRAASAADSSSSVTTEGNNR